MKRCYVFWKREGHKGGETVGKKFEKILEVNELYELLILPAGSGRVSGTLDWRNPFDGP